MTKMNTTKTLPRSSVRPARRENATSARFVALSISSTHMRMTTALRRMRTPATPRKNRIAETAMNAPTGMLMRRAPRSFVVPLHEDDRADHRREQQHRRDLERERVVAEDARRERREIAAARCRLARVAEREREEGDEDTDRRYEERGPRSLSLKEQPVGTVALRREHHPAQDQDGDRAYVNEHLERGDRLGPEEHEHPGHAEERERHEKRGAGDAVQEHDARGAADDADGEKREQDRPDAVEGHGWPAPTNGTRSAAS